MSKLSLFNQMCFALERVQRGDPPRRHGNHSQATKTQKQWGKENQSTPVVNKKQANHYKKAVNTSMEDGGSVSKHSDLRSNPNFGCDFGRVNFHSQVFNPTSTTSFSG